MITENAKNQLLEGYQQTNPFPFIIIDNFLNQDTLHSAKNYVDNLDINNADYKFYDPTWEKNKYAFQKNYNDEITSIFTYLVSDEFITYVEKLTGITGIIRNDMKLQGAGIHRILHDGFLQIHTDFNTYNSEEHGCLDRRINLLLYLNPDWKDEYNGHLLLCDRFKYSIDYKIAPLLNRCVIFNTTKNSLHGHPIPLDVPEGITRDSIAVYYYTKNNNGIDFEGDSERPTMFFNCEHFDKSNMTSL